MLGSPFAFFRGAAAVMAADLAAGPRTGLETQLSGDAHLSNFGIFAASDGRDVFSVNDFDETLPGPFEWDLKRLVASFAVVGRDRGFNAKQRETASLATARAYREAMGRFARMRVLDAWYARLEVDEVTRRWGQRVRAANLERIERATVGRGLDDHLRASGKLITQVDGEPRIVEDPPLVVRIETLVPGAEPGRLSEAVEELFDAYTRTLPADRRLLLERFRYVDAARRVTGVGSVGMRVFILLLLGRDGGDPLFLQLKEAQASVLEPFLGTSRYENHAQRVVEGQRLTQSAPDVLLGWNRTDDFDGNHTTRDYYVRQLWDGKSHARLEAMSPETLAVYGEVCGWTLARSHARSGDAVAVASYLGASDAFDRALARFAESYADQNEHDYARLAAAVASGRIAATTGV